MLFDPVFFWFWNQLRVDLSDVKKECLKHLIDDKSNFVEQSLKIKIVGFTLHLKKN